MATVSETAPCADLSAYQRDLLAVLARAGPAYGRAIKRAFEQDHVETTTARVYTNLDTLVDDGLATKEARDQRTNEYDVNEHGRHELYRYQSWLGQCLGDGDD